MSCASHTKIVIQTNDEKYLLVNEKSKDVGLL